MNRLYVQLLTRLTQLVISDAIRSRGYESMPSISVPVTSLPVKKVSDNILPGCMVADTTLMVKGHLDGLAKGFGGFGVLRVSKERLEAASQAARSLNAHEVAKELSEIATSLPTVSTSEEAAMVAQKLEQVIPKAWDLGKRCKGEDKGSDLPPSVLQKAKDLASKVKAGEMTKDEAVSTLRQEIGSHVHSPS